ncbi:MAG TPA: threonine synthase [Bacillota bacterium]
MNYVSTRGAGATVSAATAIRQGIAPDGGLFTPETVPSITRDQLEQLAGQSYSELAATILSRYLTDYQPADLKWMVAKAYAVPEKFDTAAVTPVVKLQEHTYLLELWHGPTCAFKDIALQLLPYLMTKAAELTRDSKEIVILVATSGDTGKAALEGFKDVPGTRIIVFFPEDGVSEMQRLQMVTQEGQNTLVVAVRGNFDDAQTGVKQVFTDPTVIEKLADKGMSFSSANSINWGRLAPQLVYYFYGYLELYRRGVIKLGERLNVAVPTGNFGNILAAYLAKTMGLPLGKLICASNANKVLTDFINTGIYNRNRPFYTTSSPSMDILISSNLERLLYYLSDRNATQVTAWMDSLKRTGHYRVDQATFSRIQELFYAGYADEAETLATIKAVYQDSGVVLDPHTAVGAAVVAQYLAATADQTPVLLAATASPFKFNASVLRALAGPAAVQGHNEFELLEQLARLVNQPVPAALQNLKQKPVRHRTVCERDQLAVVVQQLLGL